MALDVDAVRRRVRGALQAAAAGERGDRQTDRLIRRCAPDGALIRTVPAGPGRQATTVPGLDPDDVELVARGLVPGPLLGPHAAVLALGARPAADRRGWPGSGLLIAERKGRPFDKTEQEILSEIAFGVGMLLWAGGVSEREHQLTAVAADLRVSALQHLMSGDLIRAGRTINPLVPGLVAAGAGSVAVVECQQESQRAAMAADAEDAVADTGLVVLCPANDRQVIVLWPMTQDRPRLAPVLKPAVHADRAAGVSTVVPWVSTASAYEAAVEALAQARGVERGTRIRVHDGRPPLSTRLGTDARMWASAVLQPLDDLSTVERADLLEAAALTLWWGPEIGGRLLGWTKETLHTRLATLAGRVGLDTTNVWQRAALYLAVRLAALPAPAATDDRIQLADILDHPRARDWAEETLGPMSKLPQGDALRRTAAAWLASGIWLGAGDAGKQEVADRIGISKTTLYRRLGKVSAVVRHDITRYPGPAMDLLYALLIAGDLTMGDLPPLTRSPDVRQAHPDFPGFGRINTSRSHPARIRNHLLGGDVNFAADRAAAASLLEAAPLLATAARQNQAFLHRAVRHAVRRSGLRQVLAVAPGIPTPPGIHDVALDANHTARVVYVDDDPVVLTHTADLLAAAPAGSAVIVRGDPLSGAALHDMPEIRDTLDLTQPIAVILDFLHLVPGQAAYDLVRDLAAPLAPGSLICIAHPTADWTTQSAIVEIYGTVGIPACARTHDEVLAFGDLGRPAEPVDPGVVAVPLWHPDTPEPDPPPYMSHALVLQCNLCRCPELATREPRTRRVSRARAPSARDHSAAAVFAAWVRSGPCASDSTAPATACGTACSATGSGIMIGLLSLGDRGRPRCGPGVCLSALVRMHRSPIRRAAAPGRRAHVRAGSGIRTRR